MRNQKLRRAWWLVLAVMLAVPRWLHAGEIVQHFPADEQESRMQTKWRVVWGIENHAGGAQVLYVKEAYFTRAPGTREIKVLGDSRLAEIFVPYNRGINIYDISDFSWSLAQLNRSALGPACIVPGQLYKADGSPAETGPVAVEVHDDHLRWMKNWTDTCRRGQELHLWSVLKAGNYRYVILYVFRDDGQISFRVGATASNLFDCNVNCKPDDNTHPHIGCWRVNLELGKQEETWVEKVTLDTRQRKTIVEPVKKEQRIGWKLEELTRLRIQNIRQTNGHNPQNYVGYELIPMSSGVGRYYGTGEEFTQQEFWVTRDSFPPELRCRDLATYEKGRDLSGGKPVLWHLATTLHRQRDEDFGPVGYTTSEGAAITSWAGFDLKPRNLFPSTPLYPGGAPKCSPE